MFNVELDIFSGRPNPTWSLDAAEEREFLTRLLDRSVPMAPVNTSEGKLGYRGFIVRADGATAATLSARHLPTSFRVRDGLGENLDFSSESWLLYSGQASDRTAAVDGVAAKHLATAAPADADAVAAACGLRQTSTTDFSKWNDAQQWDNNCYNYASNNPTDTYAQPGYGSGEMYHDITVPEIHDASVRDGYLDDCAGSTKKQNLMVWFCISPGWDYHWYRQTKPVGGESRWCHKMGGTPARNTDDSGKFISDQGEPRYLHRRGIVPLEPRSAQQGHPLISRRHRKRSREALPMERRQFLTGVLATSAAAVGLGVVAGGPALGASEGSAKISSTEQWLLSTGRRALA